MFSYFGTTKPACDRQTHDDSVYRASTALGGKNQRIVKLAVIP